MVSETLSPTHGLEPGFDYIEVDSPEELTAVAATARRDPEAFHLEKDAIEHELRRLARTWGPRP